MVHFSSSDQCVDGQFGGGGALGARDQCSAAGRCGHADDGGDPFRAFSHFSEREAHLAPAGFLNSAALLAPGTAAGWRRGWRRTHAHEGGRHLSREARPSASVPSWLDVQSLETWLEARWSAAWVPLVRDAGGGGGKWAASPRAVRRLRPMSPAWCPRPRLASHEEPSPHPSPPLQAVPRGGGGRSSTPQRVQFFPQRAV